MSIRVRTIAITAALTAAVGAALVLLNLLLLRSAAAENDPLGRLNPTLTPSGVATVPSWTIRPERPEAETTPADGKYPDRREREGSDD